MSFRIFEVKLALPGVEEQTIYVGAHNGHEINRWAKEKDITNDCVINETDYTEETLKADGKELAEKAFKEEPEKKVTDLVQDMIQHGWKFGRVLSLDISSTNRAPGTPIYNDVWIFVAERMICVRSVDETKSKIISSKCLIPGNHPIEIEFDVNFGE